MEQVTVVFTKSEWDIVSWLIRWALPRSRFSWALSSHCLVKLGDVTYDMGVGKTLREVTWEEAMKGRVIVAERTFFVPNREAGILWARDQIGKKYDLKGAIGLSINPDRDWSDERQWFCYEFAAGFLKASGMDIFHDLAHITEMPLLALRGA